MGTSSTTRDGVRFLIVSGHARRSALGHSISLVRSCWFTTLAASFPRNFGVDKQPCDRSTFDYTCLLPQDHRAIGYDVSRNNRLSSVFDLACCPDGGLQNPLES